MLVDGPGDELLAGAALAGDQHRHVLGGDAADRLVHLAHGRRTAQDRVVRVGVRLGFSEDGGRLHPPGDLQGLANDPPQMTGVERLGEVVAGALLHRLDRLVGRPGRGDEDDRGPQAHPADLPVDLKPGLIGQVGVEKDDVGAARANALEPLGTGAHDLDSVRGAGNACRSGPWLEVGSSSMSSRLAMISLAAGTTGQTLSARSPLEDVQRARPNRSSCRTHLVSDHKK